MKLLEIMPKDKKGGWNILNPMRKICSFIHSELKLSLLKESENILSQANKYVDAKRGLFQLLALLIDKISYVGIHKMRVTNWHSLANSASFRLNHSRWMIVYCSEALKKYIIHFSISSIFCLSENHIAYFHLSESLLV